MGIELRLTGDDAQRVIVAGRSGQGKTTFSEMLASRAQQAVWIDPKGMNEAERQARARGATGTWSTVVRADRFVDLQGSARRASYLRRLLEEHGRIVVQLADRPDLGEPSKSDKLQVDAVAEASYTLGNHLFICDDMQGVYESRPTYYLHRVATMGRSRGVGAMCLVTSVLGFPLDFLRSANHVIAFGVHDRLEVDRLASVAPEFSELAALQRYEHIWDDHDNLRVYRFGPVKIGSGAHTS